MIACAFYFRFAILSLLFVNCVHLWPIFVCFSTVLFSLSVEPLLSPTVFTPTIRDLDMCADTVGPLIGYSRADLVSFWTPELRIDRKTRKTLFHYQLWCPRFRRFGDRYDRRRGHRFGGPKSIFVSARRSTLGVGIINARSLNQKHASIHDSISECSLDILAVTESWHSDDQDLTLRRAVPNGYSCLAVSRAESDVSFEGKTKGENVRGGGVAIIYRDCWRASKINIQDKLTSFEFLCTRVDVKPTSIIVCTVYRSQPITDKFFDEFRRLLEQLVTHRCPLVIVGDFNLHFEKNDNMHTKRFNRLLQSFGLQQHVNNPTHNQGGYWTFSSPDLIFPLLRFMFMPHPSQIIL